MPSDEWKRRCDAAAAAAAGESVAGERARRSRATALGIEHLLQTYFDLTIDGAELLAKASAAEREAIRGAMVRALISVLDRVDAAEVGRMVSDLAIGTNALRASKGESVPDDSHLRAIFDGLIERYFATVQVAEANEAVVSISLAIESFLHALAEATVSRHDLVEASTSAGARSLNHVVRGFAQYAEKIAAMPDGTFTAAGRVLEYEADPAEFGRFLNALLSIQARLVDANPRAVSDVAARFTSGIDPALLERTIDDAATNAIDAMRANPAVAKVLLRSLVRAGRKFAAGLVVAAWSAPNGERPAPRLFPRGSK